MIDQCRSEMLINFGGQRHQIMMHDARTTRYIRDCCRWDYPFLHEFVPSTERKKGMPLRGDYAYEIIAAVLTHHNSSVRDKKVGQSKPLRSCSKTQERLPTWKLLQCVANEMLIRLDITKDRVLTLCKWLNRNRNWSTLVKKILATYDMVGPNIMYKNRKHQQPQLQTRRGCL